MKDSAHLQYISLCIDQIEIYTTEGKEYFMNHLMAQDAVLRKLHTLAESTQMLSKELKDSYPGIPWKNISAFRNVVVHDYLGVDVKEIWKIVERDIPVLKKHIRRIITDRSK